MFNFLSSILWNLKTWVWITAKIKPGVFLWEKCKGFRKWTVLCIVNIGVLLSFLKYFRVMHWNWIRCYNHLRLANRHIINIIIIIVIIILLNTQSTLLPQQLLGRTVAWAIDSAFHWRGLVGQFATVHQHLPQFWIFAKWITINLGPFTLYWIAIGASWFHIWINLLFKLRQSYPVWNTPIIGMKITPLWRCHENHSGVVLA